MTGCYALELSENREKLLSTDEWRKPDSSELNW
jgi:hypothetical protein